MPVTSKKKVAKTAEKKVEAPQLQTSPPVYVVVISGRWLLEHTTPSWRIKDPKKGFRLLVLTELDLVLFPLNPFMTFQTPFFLLQYLVSSDATALMHNWRTIVSFSGDWIIVFFSNTNCMNSLHVLASCVLAAVKLRRLVASRFKYSQNPAFIAEGLVLNGILACQDENRVK